VREREFYRERETDKISENQAFTRKFLTKEEEATVSWREHLS
jgi:hypothetical protein